MPQQPWLRVREELGQLPILEGVIEGETPLYVERYMFQATERSITGLDCPSLINQFGGGQVSEGERNLWRSQSLPTQSMLMPAGVPTHWHYSGTVDFVAFYFEEGGNNIMANLTLLAAARDEPLAFNDPLVGASAHQLVSELHKGPGADPAFMTRLASVMLEQVYRVLTTPGTGGINPRHTHFARLQAVLNHIHQHLTDDLSADALAARAGVSQAHFRRLFQDAVGMAPHRYVLAARLEQARRLLSMSELPIAHIAQDCGFSSQSHLTSCFRAAHAVTPAHFRTQLARRKRP